MPTKTVAAAAEHDLSALIAAVVALAEKKSAAKKNGKNADFPAFIRQFFAGSPPDELRARSTETLLEAASRAWELLQTHKTGTPKIKISNLNGGNPRTIVQIVNDDMPFLVSSVSCELDRMEMSPLLVIHPVLSVRRDMDGTLEQLCAPNEHNDDPEADNGIKAESVMHIEIAGFSEDEMLERLRDNITAVLGDVRFAVRDWAAMRREVGHFAADFDGPVAGVKPARTKEVTDFLRWLHDGRGLVDDCIRDRPAA